MLRKLTPYFLFGLLGLLFVVLKPAYQSAFSWFYHAAKPEPIELNKATYVLAALGDTTAIATVRAAETANQQNATSAQIEAAKDSGGWVPSGTVGSKFLTFAAIYLLMVLWPFAVQRLTHPAPTKWQLESYSTVFNALPDEAKLLSVRAIQQNNAWRAIGAALFAALVV